MPATRRRVMTATAGLPLLGLRAARAATRHDQGPRRLTNMPGALTFYSALTLKTASFPA